MTLVGGTEFQLLESNLADAYYTPKLKKLLKTGRLCVLGWQHHFPKWLANWRGNCTRHFGSKPQEVFLDLLTNEFLEFLEQNDMNASAIANDDLDLLGAYFSQDVWKKVRDLMASVRALVVPLLAEAYGEPRRAPETEAREQTQILWDWPSTGWAAPKSTFSKYWTNSIV